jgi:hypothetical protein
VEKLLNRKRVALAFAAFMLAAAMGSAACADIFYSVSDYVAGSVGIIRGSSAGGYVINAKLVSNFNGDTQGFSFRDHDGRLRAMVRERSSGAGDSIWVYAPPDFSASLLNRVGMGSNIHAAASDGDDLYLVTYESYPNGPEDTGEVVRVDMRNGYAVKNRYHNPKFFYAGFADYARPHGEGVMVRDGKVYVMFGMSDPSKVLDYAPTEIVEFERNLVPTGRKAVLELGTQIGKNALTMKMYGDKLYVGCIGGRQGTGVFGDVWEIDMTAFGSASSVRQVLDFEKVTGVLADAGWGAYGIDFTDDGTAFILAGGYNAPMDFKGRLFKIPADKLARGGQDAVDALERAHDFTNASGHSWWNGVTWDVKSSTVWCMAGTHLFAFDKNGSVKRDFTPLELGEDIYSVSLLNETFPAGPVGEAATPPVDSGDLREDVEIIEEDYLTIVTVPENGTVADALNGLGLPTTLEEPESKFNVNSAGQLEANAWAVQQGLSAESAAGLDQDSLTPIPVFKATSVAGGRTALVSMKLNFSGTGVAGHGFDKLTLLKLKNDGRHTDKLTRVSDWADMTHGTFMITDENGVSQSGAIQPRKYFVSAAIRDGSEYDWCEESETVVDPIVAAIDEGDPYPETPEGGGGMPGGCAAGSGGVVALAAAVVWLLYGRKRG